VIRRGPWKLIETFDPQGLELYNLADDLGETNNLAAANPELAGDLRRELDAWRQDVGAERMRANPDCDPNIQFPAKKKKKKGGQ
jgi:arylsulfatase A-like enzyme